MSYQLWIVITYPHANEFAHNVCVLSNPVLLNEVHKEFSRGLGLAANVNSSKTPNVCVD